MVSFIQSVFYERCIWSGSIAGHIKYEHRSKHRICGTVGMDASFDTVWSRACVATSGSSVSTEGFTFSKWLLTPAYRWHQAPINKYVYFHRLNCFGLNITRYLNLPLVLFAH